jgi:hypothetical protein
MHPVLHYNVAICIIVIFSYEGLVGRNFFKVKKISAAKNKLHKYIIIDITFVSDVLMQYRNVTLALALAYLHLVAISGK